MSQRYRLLIQYDGTEFCGWQRQRRGRSVQQELEEALRELNRGTAVSLIGSGRTDAGVHATGQVAHVDLARTLDPETIRRALNAKTGRDLQVRDVQNAAPDFHARFQARRRHYLYRICRQPAVLERRSSWLLTEDLAEERLQACAEQLCGEHDFSRLSKAAAEARTKICRIVDSEWIKEDIFLNYRIVGNRFLHSMVRMLVGTMISVARGQGQVADFAALLTNRESSLKVFTAPPQGLLLQRVEYD